MRHVVTSGRFIAVLTTVVALTAGCGGGVDDAAEGPSTDDAGTSEFVDDLNSLCDDLFAQNSTVSDALFGRLGDIDFTDQQRVDDIATEFEFGSDQLVTAIDEFESGAAALELPADVQQAVDDTAATLRDVAATHTQLAAAIAAVDADQLRLLSDQYGGDLADRMDVLATTFRSLGLDDCAGSDQTGSAAPSPPTTTTEPSSSDGIEATGEETAPAAFAAAIDETGVSTTGAGYETFETVTDDTGHLSVDVPPEWSDRQTSTTTAGSDNPEIIASTDLDSVGDGAPRLDVFVIRESGDRDVQDVLDTMASGNTGAEADCQAQRAHVFDVQNGAGAVQAYSSCNGTDEAWLFVAFTDQHTDILTGLATHAVTTADLDAISNAVNSVSFTP